jgi:hypothetical protein
LWQRERFPLATPSTTIPAPLVSGGRTPQPHFVWQPPSCIESESCYSLTSHFCSVQIPALKKLSHPLPEHINQPTKNQPTNKQNVIQLGTTTIQSIGAKAYRVNIWPSGSQEQSMQTKFQQERCRAPAGDETSSRAELGRGSIAAEENLTRPIDQAMAVAE